MFCQKSFDDESPTLHHGLVLSGEGGKSCAIQGDFLSGAVRLCLFNHKSTTRPRGLMDKASDFGSEDCEFESRRGQSVLIHTLCPHTHTTAVGACAQAGEMRASNDKGMFV